MLRTFNCGIGMILVVDAARAGFITQTLMREGESVHVLGSIIPRGPERVVYL